MDKIEIRVESQQDGAVRQPWAAVFGLAGGTIGRSGQNKLVLPDADAHVARVHAMVRLEAGNAYIANLCERRAILVGDQELQSGQETVLPVGARVVIGPYQLRAVVPGTPAEVPAAAPAVPQALATMPLPVAKPAAATPALDDNPFAFIGRVEAPAPPPPAKARPVAPPPALPDGARPLLIPDDFDPFARDVEAERRAQDGWVGGLPMQSLSDVAPVPDGLLRALPAIDRVDVPSPLARQAVHGLPASLDPQPGELDPLRLFDSAPTLPGMAPESARLLHGSELGQAFRLPQVTSPAVPATPASTPRPAAPPARPEVQAAGLKQVQGLDLAMFDTGAGSTADIPIAPEATVFSHINADLAPTQLLPMRRASAPALPSLDLDLGPAASPAAAPAPLPVPAVAPPAPTPRPAPNVPAAAHAAPPPPPAPMPAPVVPVPVPVPVPTATPAPAPAAALSADEQQALLKAFIEGIGLSPDSVKAELTPEFMRRFGQAFRSAVQGTMDLLHARSEIKREFRADVTIMATRANNPLKFLPDADGVMMQMVGQTFPGFMQPVPAMQEAFRDLRVHQLALMAGIRAAYAEALTRFDPQQLEKHAADPGGLLAKLTSTRRKAALWDDYKQRYADIRRHAEDDLTAFSGRTFVKAYEAAADAAEDEAFGPGGKLP